MARKGDGLYLRGSVWYLDCRINGQRHVVKLGKNIKRTVAGELANVKRAGILKGEAGIGNKKRDLPFDEARKRFETWAMANKKPGTVKDYKECLRRLSESFSGKRSSEVSPFLVEKHKQGRIAAGARVRANRELAVLKASLQSLPRVGTVRGRQPRRHRKDAQGASTAAAVSRTAEEGRLLDQARSRCDRSSWSGSIADSGSIRGLDAQVARRGSRAPDRDGTPPRMRKTATTRSVPLNSTVRATLDRLPRRGEFVFEKNDGAPYPSDPMDSTPPAD